MVKLQDLHSFASKICTDTKQHVSKQHKQKAQHEAFRILIKCRAKGQTCLWIFASQKSREIIKYKTCFWSIQKISWKYEGMIYVSYHAFIWRICYITMITVVKSWQNVMKRHSLYGDPSKRPISLNWTQRKRASTASTGIDIRESWETLADR